MKADIFNIDTVLLTGKTVARRFRENDGASFHELVYANKSRIEDHLPKTVKAVNNAENGERFIRRKISQWLLQKEFAFGVFDENSAQLIGYISVHDVDWDVPMASLGYFIDRNFSQKGIMTEVLKNIVHYCFQQLKLEKIVLKTAMDNYPSQRLARKCGFRREGDIRSSFRKPSGEIIDMMHFGFSRQEYEKV